MKCQCCDRVLNDYESTVRLKSTEDFADTCNSCRKEIGDELYYGRTDVDPHEFVSLEELADDLLKDEDGDENGAMSEVS